MKIYLLDISQNMISWWEKYFKNCENVEVVCDEFSRFMNSHNDIQCIVSPANSYGLMDGGYDLAITKYFGDELQQKVQEYIIENLYGEQPVGTSIIVDINDRQKLIHTPSMRIPSRIKDPMVVYHCMRTCLMTAINNNVENIVIPAFGGSCGELDFSIIANMMYHAYDQVFNNVKKINWAVARSWTPEYTLR